MKLLRGAGLSYSSGGRDSDADLVKSTLPVLARGSSGASGERLANLLAHMGWADYLRGGRAGSGGLDPVKQYRSALEADPANVYAHAMWGFELLRERGSSAALAEARRHFSAALETGREREYLRYLEVSALLQTYTNMWIENPERQREVIRVVNAMRIDKETGPKGWGPGSFKDKVWSVYHFGFVAKDERVPLLAALPPADHLATFRWLFPEDDLATDRGEYWLFEYLFFLAQVEEYGGDRAGALVSYRRLLGEFVAKKYNSSRAIKMVEQVNVAIRRLGGLAPTLGKEISVLKVGVGLEVAVAGAPAHLDVRERGRRTLMDPSRPAVALAPPALWGHDTKVAGLSGRQKEPRKSWVCRPSVSARGPAVLYRTTTNLA
jgi:hypothetical protein